MTGDKGLIMTINDSSISRGFIMKRCDNCESEYGLANKRQSPLRIGGAIRTFGGGSMFFLPLTLYSVIQFYFSVKFIIL